MRSAPARSIPRRAPEHSRLRLSTPWPRPQAAPLSTARVANARLPPTKPHGGSAMAVYRRVLLVVDLTDDSVAIGRKAQALASTLGAEVELLHVVEFVPVEPMGETLMPAVQIEEELLQRAQQRLAALAADLGLAGAPCRVESGNVKAEIVRVARERQADLIVLGSRERHGLSILVNLTEDTVLHAAPCDVLAMRARA